MMNTASLAHGVQPVSTDYRDLLDRAVRPGYWGCIIRHISAFGASHELAVRKLNAALAFMTLVSYNPRECYVLPTEVDDALDLLALDTNAWAKLCCAIGTGIFIYHWPTGGSHTNNGYHVATTREAMRKMNLPVDAELWGSKIYRCGCSGTCDHGACR